MSKGSEALDGVRQSWDGFIGARSAQERKMLGLGGAAVVLALLYGVGLEPALEGRAKVAKALPELRQQQAQMQALAQEAQAYAARPPSNGAPMGKETLETSMSQRSLTGQVQMLGEQARVQLNSVPFSAVVNWLDELQKTGRISVVEASVASMPTPGVVSATLTLRQSKAE